MFEYPIFKGRRYAVCLYYVCFALFMIFPSGCGNDTTSHSTEDIGSSDSSRTGSAAFSVQWHTTSDDLQAANIRGEQAIEDCATVGIEYITCEVYDAADNPVASGGPWSCEDHQGIIESIPSGSNFTFTVLGWDTEQASILFHGQATEVTINPGQIEELDPIDAYEFVPTNLSASPISDSQIDLTWTIDPDISGAIAGYHIYRDGVIHATETSTTYSDTTDLGQSIHCYTVSAYDIFGNTSGLSNQECASTNDNPVPIVAITSPEDHAAYNQGMSPSIDFIGTAEDSENVPLSGESLVWASDIDDVIGIGNSFSNIGLSAGVHTITLTATDQRDASASASITLTITDTESPTAPGNLVATEVSANQIDLSWTASTDQDGVAQYEIFRDDVLAGTTTAITYSDRGLAAGTRYCYTVRALDATGNASDPSNESCAPTMGIQPVNILFLNFYIDITDNESMYGYAQLAAHLGDKDYRGHPNQFDNDYGR